MSFEAEPSTERDRFIKGGRLGALSATVAALFALSLEAPLTFTEKVFFVEAGADIMAASSLEFVLEMAPS